MTIQEPIQPDTPPSDDIQPGIIDLTGDEQGDGEDFSKKSLEEQANVIADHKSEITALEADFDLIYESLTSSEPSDEEYSELDGEISRITSRVGQINDRLAIFIPLHSIAKARSFTKETRQLLPKTAVIDLKKIRWARSDQEKEVELTLVENSSDPRGSYYFAGFITGENSSTKKAHDNFKKQSEAKKLTKLLIEEKIPAALIELDNTGKIRSGGGELRPDTDYDDYKIGLGGTNNRVILLQIGTAEDGRKIIVVAAVYKHTDDSMIYNALYKAKRMQPI